MSGFCTHCRVRFESSEGLTECPNCGTKSIPCSDEGQVTVSVNWHELHLLCCWAERWGQGMVKKKEGGPGVVYSIALALQEQHPERGSLTLAGEVNELKKKHPGTTLHGSDGEEIPT